MATPNRAGNRDTGTREKILDATAEIMLEEGYAAATSRRVAEKVGVQRAVVYYYFPTMDDLYLAVLRRGTELNLDVQRRALASDNPLHALWDMTIDSRGSRLTMEFMALGNHRKAIRAELAAGARAIPRGPDRGADLHPARTRLPGGPTARGRGGSDRQHRADHQH